MTMVKMSLSLSKTGLGDYGDFSPRPDCDDGRTVTWFSPSLQDWTGDDGEDVTCLSPGLDWVTMVTFLQDWTR